MGVTPVTDFAALAEAIVDSDSVIRVYAACEWAELGENGHVWITAIVREAVNETEAVCRDRNAATITALADLYEALVKARAMLVLAIRTNVTGLDFDPNDHPAIRQINAALAKANPATLAQPNGPADPAAYEASRVEGEWGS